MSCPSCGVEGGVDRETGYQNSGICPECRASGVTEEDFIDDPDPEPDPLTAEDWRQIDGVDHDCTHFQEGSE